MMTDNNHTPTEDKLLDAHEESLLRSALNRRAIPKPDVDEAWMAFSSKYKIDNRNNTNVTLQIFHIILAVAACLAVAFFIVRPFVSEKDDIAALPHQESLQSTKDSSKHKALHQSQEASPYHTSKEQEGGIKTQTVAVPAGIIRSLTLPDGTRVWLNAGSKLSYAFGKTTGERRMTLAGEGYFEVHHDAKRPFTVEADGITVTDIGTQFNIKAYKGAKTEIVVVEGRVMVNLNDKENSKEIDAGKLAIAKSGNIEVAPIDTYPYTQWRNGVFYYHDTPLIDVVSELGHWYGCNIIIESNRSIDTRIHFVAGRKQKIGDVIEQLNDIDGIDVSYNGSEIVIH